MQVDVRDMVRHATAAVRAFAEASASLQHEQEDSAAGVPRDRSRTSRVDAFSWEFACSAGALLLAIALWLIAASGAGQPLRALVVVAFLAAPGLVAARFVRGLEPIETAMVGLGAAVATWGFAAALTFVARQSWSPEAAVIFVSMLVGIVSAIDVSRTMQARRKASM